MRNHKEQKILNELSKHSDKAYQLIVESYASLVYSACLNHVPRKEDAEDLTQEVFIALYMNLHKFEGRSKISTWIYGIVLNKCKEFHRHQNRGKRKGQEQSLDDENIHWMDYPTTDISHPGIQLERKEKAKFLFHALERLPEKQKDAYTLNKMDGLSYAETAEVMNTSVTSVESLLFRANKNLRKLLGDFYEKNLR